MKIKRLIKDNLLGFVIGAIVFSSIGVVAATTLGPSDYWFKTTKNSNVENVEDALDDLYTYAPNLPIVCYNGVCGELLYRYWNNSFAGSTGENLFDSTHMPTVNYATRESLEHNYGAINFADNPVYIRSVLIDGNIVGHQTCLWYNNSEFCFSNDYWAGTIDDFVSGPAVQTQLKLQRDMQEAFNISMGDVNCTYVNGYASCYVDDYGFNCYSSYSGYVYCNSVVTQNRCNINASGSAYCYHWQ